MSRTKDTKPKTESDTKPMTSPLQSDKMTTPPHVASKKTMTPKTTPTTKLPNIPELKQKDNKNDINTEKEEKPEKDKEKHKNTHKDGDDIENTKPDKINENVSTHESSSENEDTKDHDDSDKDEEESEDEDEKVPLKEHIDTSRKILDMGEGFLHQPLKALTRGSVSREPNPSNGRLTALTKCHVFRNTVTVSVEDTNDTVE